MCIHPYIIVHMSRFARSSKDRYRMAIIAAGSIYQTLSIECPSLIYFSMFFWHVLCVIVPFFFLSFLSCFLNCFHALVGAFFVHVPLTFSCPPDHVPDWQPRILLGMVEADRLM